MVVTRRQRKAAEQEQGDSASALGESTKIMKAPLEDPTATNILVGRNIAIAVIAVWILDTLLTAYEETGVFLDFTLLLEQIGGYTLVWVILINLVYVFFTILTLPALPPLNLAISLPIYLTIQAICIIAPYYTLRMVSPVPTPVQGACCGLEMIIVVMKCHSFFFFERDHVKKDDELQYRAFLMFMIFPTLSYKRKYPRTNKIRISFVLVQIAYCVGSFLALYVTAVYHVLPERFLIAKRGLLRSILAQSLTGLLTWLLSFFGIWHAMLCLISEMTYFADRSRFYKAWWEISHFQYFWSSWNVVTAQWMRVDLYNRLTRAGLPKFFAMTIVMLIAGLFHELALLYAFDTVTFWITFFYMLSIGVSTATSFAWFEKSLIGNLFLWFFLLIGSSGIILLHASVYTTGGVPLLPSED